MAAITPASMRALEPGKWIWDRGVGVYKARDGSLSWYIRYYATHPDGTRTQEEERVYDAENRKQADDVRTARRAEVFRGTWKPLERHKKITFADFALGDGENQSPFLKAKKKLRSWKRYEQQLRLHIVPHFGRSLTLGAITSPMVKEYYEKRLGEVSQATARLELNCLKSVFSEAVEQGLLLKNPAVGVRTTSPNNARRRRISKDEVRRLFKAAGELPWKMGRIDEAQSLERDELDFENKTIRLKDSKTATPRTIPILPELELELKPWVEQYAGERYVFPGIAEDELGGEKPVSNTPVRKYWRSLLNQTADFVNNVPAIADLTPHDLRHHFAKVLIDRGVEPRMVMAILGWTSWQMLQRYVLPDEDEVREAVIKATRGEAAA
jgi:integrase